MPALINVNEELKPNTPLLLSHRPVFTAETTTAPGLIFHTSNFQPGAVSPAMSFPRFIASALAVLIGQGIAHADSLRQESLLVEVFSTADRPVQWETGDLRKIDLRVYELDRIRLFETALSNDLPNDPDQAREVVLQRIQQLDERSMPALQHAAVGLAKAIQTGVDRYPAILFDGEAVVYGLTDLGVALEHYRAWRTGVRP